MAEHQRPVIEDEKLFCFDQRKIRTKQCADVDGMCIKMEANKCFFFYVISTSHIENKNFACPHSVLKCLNNKKKNI